MNLLWDAARKCIDTAEWFRENENITGWRKSKAWRRDIKKVFRISSRTSSLGGKNKEERLHSVVGQYLEICKRLNEKVEDLQSQVNCLTDTVSLAKQLDLKYYHEMLIKHIDLVDRRILQGEKIPSVEKLYSIFETHAEWLTKGKKFKPVEIGHNVLIATDQFNFIIHHQVLENQTDVETTQHLASKLTEKYPKLINTLSLDKGFYSKKNKEFVEKIIPNPVMPKKGKRNKEETKREREPSFKKLRNAHSTVESNIHQLGHNGLNRCPDKGIKNFKRYTSLSVLAYNLHKLGEYIVKEKIQKKAA